MRFGYLYNVVIWALFPKEHAYCSYGAPVRTLRARLQQIGSLLNGAVAATIVGRLGREECRVCRFDRLTFAKHEGTPLSAPAPRGFWNLCTSVCISRFWEA